MWARGGEDIWEISVLSFQFCYKSKITLKLKVKKILGNKTTHLSLQENAEVGCVVLKDCFFVCGCLFRPGFCTNLFKNIYQVLTT